MGLSRPTAEGEVTIVHGLEDESVLSVSRWLIHVHWECVRQRRDLGVAFALVQQGCFFGSALSVLGFEDSNHTFFCLKLMGDCTCNSCDNVGQSSDAIVASVDTVCGVDLSGRRDRSFVRCCWIRYPMASMLSHIDS